MGFQVANLLLLISNPGVVDWLHYFQEGSSKVTTGGKDYDLAQGDNMLIKQGQQ